MTQSYKTEAGREIRPCVAEIKNNASQSGQKEEEMNDRMRAVQIINKMTVNKMALGREYSREQLDDHLHQFAEACKALAEIPDGDVQLVLAILLRDNHVLNIRSCQAWHRLCKGA